MLLSVFQSVFRRRPSEAARQAYIALLAQSRNPYFYTSLDVPDTLDGRFELIVLHLFLLQERLRTEEIEFARHLSEVFFEELDASIRELGIGDSGVLHRVKRMGKAYHGRLQAYAQGMASADDETLKSALARNLYGTVAEGETAHLQSVASYMRAMQHVLQHTETAALKGGSFAWPAPNGYAGS